MYAIVDIAGQQFKVEKDQKIFVHRLNGESGSNMFFHKVLLIDNGKNVTVGNPIISDALISVKILSHVKGDKIKVFKKKRRKAYQILKGHRQLLTEIQIDDILEKGGSKFMKEASVKDKKEKPVKKTAIVEEQAVVSPDKEAIKTTPEKKTKKVSQKKEAVGESTKKAKTTSVKKVSESKPVKSKPAKEKKDKTSSTAKDSKSKKKPIRKPSPKKTDKPAKK